MSSPFAATIFFLNFGLWGRLGWDECGRIRRGGRLGLQDMGSRAGLRRLIARIWPHHRPTAAHQNLRAQQVAGIGKGEGCLMSFQRQPKEASSLTTRQSMTHKIRCALTDDGVIFPIEREVALGGFRVEESPQREEAPEFNGSIVGIGAVACP